MPRQRVFQAKGCAKALWQEGAQHVHSLKKAQVAGPAGRSMMQDVAKEEEKARSCVGIIGDFENSCGQ